MEEWRDVVGYEGIYTVSDEGRVKRIALAYRRKVAGNILKPIPSHDGYSAVGLYLNGRGPNMVRVHRLVAIAFLGQPPSDKHEVNHKNGIRNDNRSVNLEWVTRSENLLHAQRTLNRPNPHGEGHHKTYFTENDVREIRRAYAAKEMGQVPLARRFGTTQATISRIIKRQTWGHVL